MSQPIRANTHRRTDGRILVSWHARPDKADAEAYAVPKDKAVTVTIHGDGCLLGSADGRDFAVALDTANKPILGRDIGARHVKQAYAHLKPGQNSGPCELIVTQ